MLLIGSPVQASQPKAIDCKVHKVFCQIVKNKPLINLNYAMRLSNVIFRVSKKYKLPTEIFTAILMQESSYRLNSERKEIGYRKITDEEKIVYLAKCTKKGMVACRKGIPKRIKTEIVTDYGIGQISVDTIERYKFNPDLLISNLQYSVDSSAQVLKWFKSTYSKREKDWWVRYNVGTRSKRSVRTRWAEYKKLVKKYI